MTRMTVSREHKEQVRREISRAIVARRDEILTAGDRYTAALVTEELDRMHARWGWTR